MLVLLAAAAGTRIVTPRRLLTRPPLLCSQPDQRERVDARVEQPDAPMQVGAGDAARRAGEAELLAALDDVADGHVDLRQVQVGRIEAVAVVDEHRVAAEKQVLRQHDAAAVRRVDRSARRRPQVRARMRRPRLTVEHAAMPEVASVLRASYGHGKRLGPIAAPAVNVS